jgi:hypothetical protein
MDGVRERDGRWGGRAMVDGEERELQIHPKYPFLYD